MSTRSELAIEIITPNLSDFLNELQKRNEDWHEAFVNADSFKENNSPNYLYYWKSIHAEDLDIVIKLLENYNISYYIVCITSNDIEEFGDSSITAYSMYPVTMVSFNGKLDE